MLTEHEYTPGALFSDATHGADSMPTDPRRREQVLQAQERQFFTNYQTHADLAQTPSEDRPTTATRIGSQERRHVVNG